MTRISAPVLLLMLLSACGDGQPFFKEDTTTPTDTSTDGGTTPDSGTDGGNNTDGDPNASDALNTGTVRPTQTPDLIARGDIIRAEVASADNGGGQLASVEYVPATGTTTERFLVDGLGFDGANTYSRGSPVGSLGAHAVFEADVIAFDALTGDPISQVVPYRAIYGVSNNTLDTGEPRTAFAIVRTGGYVDYGFGGFLYERNGSVVVPTSGQAQYTGDYAGVRVFQNRGGLEFTRGDMTLAVDFRDFNGNNAVQGEVTNRQVFTEAAVPITTGTAAGQLQAPDLRFVIAAGGTDIQTNGEFSGGVRNSIVGTTGALEVYEEGSYYAVLAGDGTNAADGGEVVGIIVVTSKDPRYDGVTAQETGGFIAYR